MSNTATDLDPTDVESSVPLITATNVTNEPVIARPLSEDEYADETAWNSYYQNHEQYSYGTWYRRSPDLQYQRRYYEDEAIDNDSGVIACICVIFLLIILAASLA